MPQPNAKEQQPQSDNDDGQDDTGGSRAGDDGGSSKDEQGNGEEEESEQEEKSTSLVTHAVTSGIKAKKRQNFSWRQISVLEQVFETDSHPRMVCFTQPLPPFVAAYTAESVASHRLCASNLLLGLACRRVVSKYGFKTGGRNGNFRTKARSCSLVSLRQERHHNWSSTCNRTKNSFYTGERRCDSSNGRLVGD